MIARLILGLFVGSSLLLSACNYTHYKHPIAGADGGLEAPGKGGPIQLDFASVEERVLGPACVHCHSWAKDYGTVAAKARKIKVLVQADRMPQKAPPLTAAQKSLLFSWIDAGAPQTSTLQPQPPVAAPEPEPADPVIADPGLLNWVSAQVTVIQPYCIKCHGDKTGGPTTKGHHHHLSLTTYASITKNLESIRKAVLSGKMPKHGVLPEILKIRFIEWLDQAAPKGDTE